jgi:hypothetical protein
VHGLDGLRTYRRFGDAGRHPDQLNAPTIMIAEKDVAMIKSAARHRMAA